jgi:hypothetical protein
MRFPLALLLATACVSRPVSQLDPHPEAEQATELQASVSTQIDILFVIDNSSSMKNEQELLGSSFPRFMEVLEGLPNGLPSVHIGVVSSDVGMGGFEHNRCKDAGDDGRLQNLARVDGCTPPDGLFISDVPRADGGRDRNYTGTLADTFSCIAQLGTLGCGFEQHLESMRRALTNPANEGFLRRDAYLAVYIIADEDDCSPEETRVFDPDESLNNMTSEFGPMDSFRCTEFGVLCDGAPLDRDTAASYSGCVPRPDSLMKLPDEYAQFLLDLKGTNDKLFVGVIAGDASPFAVEISPVEKPTLASSCTTTTGESADPGVRLAAFSQKFGPRGAFHSICQEDLSTPLQALAESIEDALEPCLGGSFDTTDVNPTQPGLQLPCAVTEENHTDGSERTIARCAMTDPTTPSLDVLPCWWAEADPTICPADTFPTSMLLHVERSPSAPEPSQSTFLDVRCQVP